MASGTHLYRRMPDSCHLERAKCICSISWVALACFDMAPLQLHGYKHADVLQLGVHGDCTAGPGCSSGELWWHQTPYTPYTTFRLFGYLVCNA
jgi:hypothetical protein